MDKVNGKIKLVLSDLEGVLLTDSIDGEILPEILVKFSDNLKTEGVEFAIITGRSRDQFVDELLKNRLKVLPSSINKVDEAQNLLKELNISFEDVLFIGDGLLDIPLMQKVKKSVAPKSARREVKRIVDYTVDNESVELMLEEIKKLL